MSNTGQGSHIASIVGANIRRARLERGLYQRQLGQLVGETTSGQQVSDWERGDYRPSDQNLAKLASALGRDYAWFFTEHEDEKAAA